MNAQEIKVKCPKCKRPLMPVAENGSVVADLGQCLTCFVIYVIDIHLYKKEVVDQAALAWAQETMNS
jgi:hypothetical protein